MVVRAAFAVLMLVLTLGGVVMRAAFAVLVLVLSLGGVVMGAAFAVLMLVIMFGRSLCCIDSRIRQSGNKA